MKKTFNALKEFNDILKEFCEKVCQNNEINNVYISNSDMSYAEDDNFTDDQIYEDDMVYVNEIDDNDIFFMIQREHFLDNYKYYFHKFKWHTMDELADIIRDESKTIITRKTYDKFKKKYKIVF